MTEQERYNRMICSKCHHVFDVSEAVKTTSKLMGIDVPTKVCPVCGGDYYMLEPPSDFDKWLYCDYDNKYYTYPDR